MKGTKMVSRVRRVGEVNVPVEFAFAFVADYRNVHKWMFGVSGFHPCGERVTGVGAEFRTTFVGAIGPTDLIFQAIEWQESQRLLLVSDNGPRVDAAFGFEKRADCQARISVDIGYPSVGGLAGVALRPVHELVVKQAVKHVDQSLRREVEAAYMTQRGTD